MNFVLVCLIQPNETFLTKQNVFKNLNRTDMQIYDLLTFVSITVHMSYTQHSTEQFWLSSLLVSIRSS